MLFVVFLFFTLPLFSGFTGDTLIKTDTCFVPIKQMRFHDSVESFDVTNFSRTYSCVSGVYRYTASRAVIITLINGTVIISAPHQQFYDYDIHEWKSAVKLQPYDRLFCKNNYYSAIQSVAQLDFLITLYDLTADSYHNFYITEHEILSHNAVFAVIAAAAVPIILTYGVAACALGYIAKKTINEQAFNPMGLLFRSKKSKVCYQQQKAQQEKGCNSGSSSPQIPPDDPEKFKKEHPHGRYEDAPYHKNHQSGRKSPRPIDGQAALDNSFKISESSNGRVGVSNKQIVMLRLTIDNVYHGYVIEFDNLLHELQSILIKQGIVNGRGKFL